MTVSLADKYTTTKAGLFDPLFFITTGGGARFKKPTYSTGGIYWFIYWFYRLAGAVGRRDGRRKLSPQVGLAPLLSELFHSHALQV